MNACIPDMLINAMDKLFKDLCTPNKEFVTDKLWHGYELRVFTMIETEEMHMINYLPSEYEEFLQTPYWKIIARWVKEKAGNKCSICNSPKNLNAHHRTYKNHMSEHLHWETDLFCLCQSCHTIFHKNSKLKKDTPE